MYHLSWEALTVMSSCTSQSPKQYFTECLQFLHKYKWIYDFQLTRFFTDRVWESIPPDWVSVLANLTVDELNKIPFGYYKETWPISLKHFIQSAIALTMPRSLPGSVTPMSIDRQMARGMSPKKQHEVSHLAGIVHTLCTDSGCKGIIDIGSGLGYLSLLLSHQLGYKVLGIECEEARCRNAELRTSKFSKDMPIRFRTKTFSIKDDHQTLEQLRSTLLEYFCNDEQVTKSPACKPATDEMDRFQSDNIAEGICLMGLHCCGDLTPTVLKLFTKLKEIRALIVLGCCYHRMTVRDEGGFNQFPLSEALKKLDMGTACSALHINTYGLRLAAQETRSRWKGQDLMAHTYHQNNVAFRGIFDLVMEKEKIKMSKNKRRLASKHHYKDFVTYVDTVLSRVNLDDDTNRTVLKNKLLEEYSGHEEFFTLVEPFTCLQVLLQGVLESLILIDRKQYLLENQINSELVPVMDDDISPRNVAILAWK